MTITTYNDRIEALIAAGAIPPFVYCYPTRSSYRPLTATIDPIKIWNLDLSNSLTLDLNLYIHVPFCRYKCGFCNLYTTISTDQELYDRYINAICKELDYYREVIQSRNLRTIYIGGGTPSLLALHNFDTLIEKISEIYPNWRNVTREVAIEASPDSIVARPNLVRHLKRLGFTRINLGVQSLKKNELQEAGRTKASDEVIRSAIAQIKHEEISNLSTDLIMGFHGQTDQSWEESVRELARLRPETISTYFLTVRPDAWFSKTGKYQYHRDPTLYRRYDMARECFLDAGYVQESNVRYKIPGRGGYEQKVLQFHGVPYLGIGVGARTYTNTIDYLTSGGVKPDISQVHTYITDREAGKVKITTGFSYSEEERIRKRFALDLFDLDLSELKLYHIENYRHIYADLLAASIAAGLLRSVGATRYQLTPKGYKYRDIISWLFFSEQVVSLDAEFYSTLHSQHLKSITRIGKSERVSGLPAASA